MKSYDPCGGRVSVVFRYDDLSARSDAGVEAAVFGVFEEMGIPLTVGVIPFVCAGDVHVPGPCDDAAIDAERISELLGLVRGGLFEAAQHGCTHQVVSATGGRSEFAGLPYARQLEKILRGKRHLEQFTAVRTFIPPWNSCDLHTLRALRAAGFEACSASLFSPVPIASALRFFPETVALTGLRDALLAARLPRAARGLALVVLHAHDFHESGSTRATLDTRGLRGLLRELPADTRFATIGSLARRGGYSARALLTGKWLGKLGRRVSVLRPALAPPGIALFPPLP